MTTNTSEVRIRKQTIRERLTWNTWQRPLPYLFGRWVIEFTYSRHELWSVEDSTPEWNFGGVFMFKSRAESTARVYRDSLK